MIKEYHGKVYYIELTCSMELKVAENYLSRCEDLWDETFYKTKYKRGMVLFSESPVGTFRGKKYIAWERLVGLISKTRDIQPYLKSWRA